MSGGARLGRKIQGVRWGAQGNLGDGNTWRQGAEGMSQAFLWGKHIPENSMCKGPAVGSGRNVLEEQQGIQCGFTGLDKGKW